MQNIWVANELIGFTLDLELSTPIAYYFWSIVKNFFKILKLD